MHRSNGVRIFRQFATLGILLFFLGFFSLKQLKTPVGFYMKEGRLTASNLAAERWLEMAAFDRLKRENRLSYQRLMLDILDESQGPISPPALNVPEALKDAAAARLADLFDESLRPYVAINVGSGSRWPKKMLDSEQIYRYVRDLQAKADVNVVLVGGAAETEKANQVLGMFPPGSAVNVALTGSCLPEFVALLSWVDVLLCGDTLALHVATALGLPAVVVFGPTSSNEIFDFDGLVTKVWTPELDCLVCYGDCQKPKNCMSLLNVYELVDRTITHLRRFTPP